MPRLQVNPRIRRNYILTAALRLASVPGGWNNLTRLKIANEACCSEGLVSVYLGSMQSVRSRLVRTAVKLENFDVLIQALAAGDPEAQRIRPLLKAKAFSHTLGA